MQDHQRRFLELCLQRGVLRFGNFTLKSGRKSPYFFNLGHICSGQSLAELGTAYARTLLDAGLAHDMLFGPAYKGIALAAATSIALARQGHDVDWAYNRKEVKDHGEGGSLVGAPLQGRVVVVDDVITAGTASREALQMIRDQGAQPAALLVALDRCETGPGGDQASSELAAEFDIPVLAIAKVEDLLEFTASRADLSNYHEQLVSTRAG